MRFTSYLSLKIQRLFYLLKSTGIAFWVPVVLVNVVLPLTLWSSVKQLGLEVGFQGALIFFLVIIPFMSVWWLILSMREFVESPGCELVYVNYDKSKFLDCVSVFVFYLADVFILFTVLKHWYPAIYTEMIREMLVCLFYFGVSHFLLFITRNATAALMATILYTVVNALLYLYGKETVFPFYFEQEVTQMMFGKLYVPLAVAGVLLTAVSCFINSKTSKN